MKLYKNQENSDVNRKWLWINEATLRSFDEDDFNDIFQTSLKILFLVVMWIILASIVGQNILFGEKIIFISISILVLTLSIIIFSNDENIPFFYLLLSVPSLLIIYLFKYQTSWKDWIVFFVVIILCLYLLYWSILLYDEISDDNDSISLKISVVSMSLTTLSQAIIFIPETIRKEIFSLFPYFMPFILLWHSTPIKIIRFIATMTILLLILSYAIKLTIRDKSIHSFEYSKFERFETNNSEEFINLIYNSFIEIVNYILIPILENFYHTFKIITNYMILISINFFKRTTEVFSYSIKILNRFFRFLLLPLAITGVVGFLILQISQDMTVYIHNNHSWYLAIFLLFKYFLVLFLSPYCLLIIFNLEMVFEISRSFMQFILLPHALLFLLVPIISIFLTLLNIEPYFFGFISKISATLWILGGFIFIKNQFFD